MRRYDLTCRYGAGAGNTGLSCAASRCCCDEPDIVEPVARHVNLLHVRLARDGNDGLKLGASDSAHRDGLHRFNTLRMFGREREAIQDKQTATSHATIWLCLHRQNLPYSPPAATGAGVCPSYLCCRLAGGHLDRRDRRGLLNRQELLAKRHVDGQRYRLLRSVGGGGSHGHHGDLGGRFKH